MKEALNQTQLASRLKMIRQQVTEKIKRQPLFYQSVIIDWKKKWIHWYKIVKGNEELEVVNPCELEKTTKAHADIIYPKKEEYYKLPSGYKFLKI